VYVNQDGDRAFKERTTCYSSMAELFISPLIWR